MSPQQGTARERQAPISAQIVPSPSHEDPPLAQKRWPNGFVRRTSLPKTGLSRAAAPTLWKGRHSWQPGPFEASALHGEQS